MLHTPLSSLQNCTWLAARQLLCQATQMHCSQCNRSSGRHDLNYIKWILLVFVIMEIVSLLVAFIMRCCVDPDGHYGDFGDEEVRRQSTFIPGNPLCILCMQIRPCVSFSD